MDNPTTDKGTSSRQCRPCWWTVAVLGVLVIALVAFVLGRLTADDETVAATTVVTTLTPTTTTSSTTTSTTTTTTTTPPPTTTSTTVPPTTTKPVYLEPVARVTDIAAPAVVQLETGVALGSGVIFDTEGYILTAAHVVEDAFNVEVRLSDGRRVSGFVAGAHRDTDIAVVKIDDVENLHAAELALGAELRVGQLAVALGSPFGLEQTVTAGIVSGVDRVIDGTLMVQTDAAINPGNSGGPLVDAEGRVLGINTQIFTTTGTNTGVGFAVSIDLAVIVAEQLIAGEQVRFAFLGVSVSPVPTGADGALVDDVTVGSAAEDAGIEVGDVIVAVDGVDISGPGELRTRVISQRPGDEIEIEVFREGESIVLTAVLGSG